jgi:hypothetical protein
MKIVVFGDSFSNIFIPIKNIEIHTFIGASIKGIVNKSDKYQKILQISKNTKYDIGIFLFGFVDINFYYYYKTYYKNSTNVFDKIIEYSKEYIHIIKSLPNIKKKLL